MLDNSYISSTTNIFKKQYLQYYSMFEKKVKDLDELAIIIDELKKQNKKIVHSHGVFDIVHYGHIKHFINAKEQGDILIVTITPDRFIQKGPGRPFFNEEIRLNHLASIECIDYIAINKWPTAIETIKLFKPHIYVKGKEVLENKNIDRIESGNIKKSNLNLEEEALNSIGGSLYLTDEITFSSSRIINQITDSIPDETKKFLNNFKQNYNFEDIVKILESLKKIKVLVIGDSILDEYVYCSFLDKSGKHPLLVYKFIRSEFYLGGTLAVANHLAGFTNNLTLITCIGDDESDHINHNLNKKINKNILVQNNSKTLIKKRYIDDYIKSKVFEIYNTDGLEINKENEREILKYLEENVSKFDVIIVSDFGHGMITEDMKSYLSKCGKFLAVNSQLNAGNLGYNFITKYKRADFVCLNEKELRLPFQDKSGDIKVPINRLSDHLGLNKINITLGKSGGVYYQNGNYYYVPSFTKNPVDTTGAGDAILSLTSLLAYKEVDPLVLSFLGNSVGALTVKIIGNKKSIDPIELKKFISYFLK